MSPRIPLLLNLLVLVVNFVLVCAIAENDDRALRVTTRAAAAPLPAPVLRPAPPPNRANDGAIGPVPHTRLLKFLARLDGAADFSRPQREAVYDAMYARRTYATTNARAYVECEVRQVVELGDHHTVIAEVIGAGLNGSIKRRPGEAILEMKDLGEQAFCGG